MASSSSFGTTPPVEHAEDSGFAYYGRYYRSSDGSMPAVMGPLLAPYGSFSILTLPADNDTWAVTLYGLSDDKPLRRFRDPEVYDRVKRYMRRPAEQLYLTTEEEMDGAIVQETFESALSD